MSSINSPPREGDLYRVIEIGGHRFELRFGFYEEFEREFGEPVVIYPDLAEVKLYDEGGKRIVTAIQNPCSHYKVPENKSRDECCCDCEYYRYYGDDIGTCACAENDRRHHGREPTS